MERVRPQPPLSTSKMERRIIEKNRRNHMKSLYSKLNSLLPDNISKEVLPVPDQIDEAVTYIRNLQERIEKSKEKKEGRKRPHSCIAKETATSSKLPQFEIHEMGPDMDVILINGLDKPAIFYRILRLFHEEGVEVANASFSISGNSTIQVLQGKVGKSTLGIRRLNELIYGSSPNELDSGLDLWDFEIETDVWGPETMPVVGDLSILNRA